MSTSSEDLQIPFVRQLEYDNPEQFFTDDSFSVESDCRALVVQDGRYLGEAPEGNYSLQSLAERLMFWKPKKKTIVLLVPNRSIPLRFLFDGLFTSDRLVVSADVQFSVMIGDVDQFVNNLIGIRDIYTMEDIHETIEPIVRQGLWEIVGRMTIEQINSPEIGTIINEALGQTLRLAFIRYGLEFGEVNLVSIRHQKFDELRIREGETALTKRENDLVQSEMGLRFERMELQDRWRQVVLSDRFNAMKNEDELQQALLEQDKRGVARQEDLDEFKRTYQENHADHEAARNALIRKLDLERLFEYENMRNEMGFQLKMRRLGQETQLAMLLDNESNRKWIDELRREEEEEKRRRNQFEEEQAHRRKVLTENKEFQREEQFAVILHRQRVDAISGQLEIEQTDRNRRAAEIENEIRTARQLAVLETQKRKDEWQLELTNRQFANQLERLAAIQQLNQQQQRFEQEQYERNKRLDADLSLLNDDRAFSRELQRLNLFKELGPDALLLMADTEKAAILADLKKHQASEETKQIVARSESDAEKVALNAILKEKEESEQKLNRMLEKLGEAERSKAEMLMEQLREAIKKES